MEGHSDVYDYGVLNQTKKQLASRGSVAKFTSERSSAILLLAAATLGLFLANSPLAQTFFELREVSFGPRALDLDLSIGSWTSEGLLAIFFFLSGLELLHERESGALSTWRKVAVPLAATAGGVIVPALIYLLIVSGSPGGEGLRGWPIPTATDIAFSLGVLGTFGSAMPKAARAFLLTLAVVDDLVAITIIAVFYATDINLFALLASVVTLVAFAGLARLRGARVIPLLVLLAVITWGLVHASGVHATVAGVALALALPASRVDLATRALKTTSDVVILPLFALFAAGVALPMVTVDSLSPVFWAILIALPVGKLLGISLAAYLVTTFSIGWHASILRPADIAAIAMLGGTGFTVSLLTTGLSFPAMPELVAEGTVAVLLGSLISIVLGGSFISMRSRHYRAARQPNTSSRIEENNDPLPSS